MLIYGVCVSDIKHYNTEKAEKFLKGELYMVVIIGAIIVFCLFMGVILIISGCHDYNEANRGMEIGIPINIMNVLIPTKTM